MPCIHTSHACRSLLAGACGNRLTLTANWQAVPHSTGNEYAPPAGAVVSSIAAETAALVAGCLLVRLAG